MPLKVISHRQVNPMFIYPSLLEAEGKKKKTVSVSGSLHMQFYLLTQSGAGTGQNKVRSNEVCVKM